MITDQQVEQFNELGYFVTERVFDDQILAEMIDCFESLHQEIIREAEQRGADQEELDRIRYRPFVNAAHERSELCRRFVRSPIYVEACRRLIGNDADLYYNQAVMKPPHRGRSFSWHQDSGYGETKPLAYITCWTAISRAFVENGCVWVIPGSHKWGLLPHEFNDETTAKDAIFDDDSGAIPVELNPGQVAIFSSLTLHRSGPNTSSEARVAYVPQYHVPNAILCRTGEARSGQLPVLRDGQAVAA